MAKIDLQDIASLTNEQSAIALINANSATIETESDTFLSRDGTSPNQMLADLDMNSNRIINLPEAVASGQPVRYDEFILGVAGPEGPEGPPGAPGANGTNGTNGADGASAGFVQAYSTTTSDADPGSGIFRLNNATPASATAAYLDNNDSSAVSIASFLDTWDDSTNSVKGYVQFVKVGSPGTWARFQMTGSVVDGTGYRKLTLTGGAGSGSFTNADLFSITFYPSGDKGTDGAGAGDVVGPGSSTDNAVVRFDSTTGKLLQNSAVTIADTTGLIAGSRFANTGLKLEDTNASHLLTIAPGSNISADRTLTITSGDADRTLDISAANVTISSFGASIVDDANAAAVRTTIGAGDVVGPASSTDNAIVRFDSTTGKLLQDSVVTIADTTGLIAGSRFANTGLKLEDTNASHLLTVAPGSDLSANRTLTLTTGDADRTVTVSGNSTISQDYSTSGNPQFATIELGAASDTTLARSSAGNVSIEGNVIYRAGGTDVPVADGGTGASTAAAAATNLGLGTGDSPQFTAVNIGNASDTTVARDSAGIISVEGVPLYSQIPQNSQSAAYGIVLSDAQKHILHPTADNNARTFTIPANASVAFPIGTCITFVNQINTVTIAITSDTLTLAGSGSTGSRTLAANGIATALKIASTSWIISGTGLT